MTYGHAQNLLKANSLNKQKLQSLKQQLHSEVAPYEPEYLIAMKDFSALYGNSIQAVGLPAAHQLPTFRLFPGKESSLTPCTVLAFDTAKYSKEEIQELVMECYFAQGVLPFMLEHSVYEARKEVPKYSLDEIESHINNSASPDQTLSAEIQESLDLHRAEPTVLSTQWLIGIPSLKTEMNLSTEDEQKAADLIWRHSRLETMKRLSPEQRGTSYDAELLSAAEEVAFEQSQCQELLDDKTISLSGAGQLHELDTYNRIEKTRFLRFALGKELITMQQLSIGEKNLLNLRDSGNDLSDLPSAER